MTTKLYHTCTKHILQHLNHPFRLVVACKAAILEINQYLAGDIEHLTQRMHRISADEMRTEGALDDAPEIERSLQTIRAELNALISRHGPALQAIGVPINVLLDRISGAGTGLHDIYRARRLPQEFFYEKWNAFNDVLGALTTTKRELQANLLAAHREMIDGTK